MEKEHSLEDRLIAQYVESRGYGEALRRISQLAGYREVPPDITTFLEDNDFCGKFFGQNYLWPTWKEELPLIFPNPITCPYNEIILTGSIGSGKSTCALAGMLYDLCKILYMVQPQADFGLQPTSPIVVAFINATVSLTESVLYPTFMRWIFTSPFFQREMSKVSRLDFKRRRVTLPHNIDFVSGSRARHALGQNIVMGILSELNFQSDIVKTQAAQNYEQMKNRMRSRYGLVTKVTPGRLWLDSSKTDEMGYQEQLIKESIEQNKKEEEEGLHPTAKIICKSFWETKGRAFPHMFASKKFFKVFVGDSHRDPFIPSAPGDYIGLPDDCVIDVPIELRRDFERNLMSAIRDLAGVSTWGTYKFMSQEALVKAALHLENPMRTPGQEIVALSFEEDDDQLINYVDIEKLKEMLRIDPDDPRSPLSPCFIHYDLATKHDKCGIALTRAIAEVQVDRSALVLLDNPMTRDLVLQTVLAIAVQARPGKEIPLSKVRNFFLHLMQAGIKIVGVSADSHQSKELIQQAERAGMIASIVSTDKTRDAYEYLKDAINERRWAGPKHKLLERELLNLRDEGKKIDHPIATGQTVELPSKDVADAVAGSVYWCHCNSGLLTASEAISEYAKHQRGTPPRDSERSRAEAAVKQQMQDRRWYGTRRKGL